MANKLQGLDINRIHNLGRTAYYWMCPAGGLQQNVVISAHGGIARSAAATLTVPDGFKLKFYVQHGATQNDFGINKFAAPNPPTPVEQINGGKSTYNYGLSKYQGRHSKGRETYGTIQNQSVNATSHNATLAAMFPDGKYPGSVAGPQMLFDVVTIRNRWLEQGSDLKTVLNQIKAARGNRGAVVHCFFCRSYV